MDHFGFAEPRSLLLLLALIPLAAIWYFDRRRRMAADAAYGGDRRLRLGQSNWRIGLQTGALALGLVLLVLATARPRWGSADLPVERRGIDIAIALDVSRSMTTTDVLPSRAEAAATGIQSLLAHLRTDRAGLVIFAGETFERSPLTLDMNALGQLVARAQLEARLAGQGTDLGGAIDASLALLDVEDAAQTQVIIVVSDGEDLGDGALAAASRAAEAGVRVYTVAVGTDAGAPIPGDASGTTPSRADRITLEAVAAATGGQFRELGTIAGLAIDFQQLRQSAFDNSTEVQPIERFQWFLAPAIVLLALPLVVAEAGRLRPLFRSSAGVTGLTSVLLIVGCGGSQLYQHMDAGNRAYSEGRYEDALAEYRDARIAAPEEPAVGYNLGNTLHQLRRFEEASVLSEEALRTATDPALAESLHYALGAHAVERGLLNEARSQYIAALRLDPNDIDAKANLEFVLNMIEPASVQPPDEPPTQDQPPVDEPTSTPQNDGTPPRDGASDGQPPVGNESSDTGAQGSGSGEPTGGTPGGDAGGEAGGAGGASDSQPAEGAPTDLEAATAAAQAALAEALAQAGDELTLEEALNLLKLSDQLSALQALASDGSNSGGVTDR